MISVNGETQYVTQEGSLTTSPVWITLTTKKITVKGLNPRTTYTFRAKAKNADNIVTSLSSSVSGTTLIKPPEAPTNLIATATSNQITVSWDAAVTATGYEILVDGNITDVGTSLTYTSTSLSPGTPHTYQVRAKNAGGPGNWSSQITKSTLPTSPEIPANLVAVPQITSIIVTWSNVAGAIGYDIEVDGVQVNNGPNTSYTHNGLTPGTYHTYKVRSVNSGGKSDWSSLVGSTTLYDSAAVPTNITADTSDTQITIAWDAVDGATGYDIEVDGVRVDNGTKTMYTHKNLSEGSQHIYRVRARKTSVVSNWSAMVVATTLVETFGTPANITASAQDTSVTISWKPVYQAIGYDIQLDDGTEIDNGIDTSTIFVGLTPDTNYSYKVRARSAEVTSDWSDPITVRTYVLPTPTNLVAVPTDTTIELSWTTTASAPPSDFNIEFDGSITQGIQGNTYTYMILYQIPSIL